MLPTYNGLVLPGFDTANPPTPGNPRWMIVWDARGWTAPVRRIVTGFTGKFWDTDGNSWDYGSELPAEYRKPVWYPWLDASRSKLDLEYTEWLNHIPRPNLGAGGAGCI